MHGTTSACAENTTLATGPPHQRWNYLRVRGEYFTALMRCRSTSELPPRARRIHLPAIPEGDDLGTTSACAENTPFCLFIRWGVRNYLRVRGEYTPPAKWCGWSRELPPRARRIPNAAPPICTPFGTTSACAENTALLTRDNNKHWNYLRVRGEYCEREFRHIHDLELPPRARRIPHRSVPRTLRRGTTSACAENTLKTTRQCGTKRNYLRVRGEYISLLDSTGIFGELPPRARRIQDQLLPMIEHGRNYLRVRGEYLNRKCMLRQRRELPPRARRIRHL